MIWFQDLLNSFFGDSISVFNSVGDILTPTILAVFAGIKLNLERKLKVATIQESAVAALVTGLVNKVESLALKLVQKETSDEALKKEMEEGLSILGSMFAIAFMNSPNVDPATKQFIAVNAARLETISNRALDKDAEVLIEKALAFVPAPIAEKLLEKKEEIIATASQIDTFFEKANEMVQKILPAQPQAEDVIIEP